MVPLEDPAEGQTLHTSAMRELPLSERKSNREGRNKEGWFTKTGLYHIITAVRTIPSRRPSDSSLAEQALFITLKNIQDKNQKHFTTFGLYLQCHPVQDLQI